MRGNIPQNRVSLQGAFSDMTQWLDLLACIGPTALVLETPVLIED